MRKSKELYSEEEWLANNWIGDSYKLFNVSDTIKEIRLRINKYIHKLLEKTNQSEPPFNPENLFLERKIIKKKEIDMSEKFSGILEPIEGGFIMTINSKHSSNRKRFSVAHEIGHTFFYDLTSETPCKRFVRSNSPYMVEEDYANSIAAEILLPEPYIKKTIKEKQLEPSIKALNILSRLYSVSLETMCKQVVKNHKLFDCLVFESTISSKGIINNDSSTICKGNSFQEWYWTIPKSFNSQESDLKKTDTFKTILFEIISVIFKENNTKTGSIEKAFAYRNNHYNIKTILINDYSGNRCISMITKTE